MTLLRYPLQPVAAIWFVVTIDVTPPPLDVQGGTIVSRGVCTIWRPRRSYVANPLIAVSGSSHTRNINKSIDDAVIHVQKRPPQKRLFLLGCSSPFMRLAPNLAVIRAWCKQCLPGP